LPQNSQNSVYHVVFAQNNLWLYFEVTCLLFPSFLPFCFSVKEGPNGVMKSWNRIPRKLLTVK